MTHDVSYMDMTVNIWWCTNWYTALYLFKNGFQLPCIVGLSVCHHFFNLVTLIPEVVLSKETWRSISLGVRFFTDTIRLFPFTRRKKMTLLKGVFHLQLVNSQYGAFRSTTVPQYIGLVLRHTHIVFVLFCHTRLVSFPGSRSPTLAGKPGNEASTRLTQHYTPLD